MKKNDWVFILKSFFIWRTLIFIPILLAPYFFHLQNNFLGGGIQNFLNNPHFWSWANFDGEHYISIARLGYGNGEQAFFPLYPLLIRYINMAFGFENIVSYLTVGMMISNLSFMIALIGLYKLITLGHSQKIAKISIILLLLFPTSFYFASVYTESLFLALVVWSFYFYKKDKFMVSTILGIFASATRVVGIVLLPIYLIGVLYRKKSISQYWTIGLIPLGLAAYMYFSWLRWGDFLKFFNVASGFGEQRSDHLILLPQVFYRYVVKIIPNLSWSYFPVIFTTFLEILVAAGFLSIIFYVFFKKIQEKKIIDSSYWLYLVFGYVVPTLSGSFSSLPRYVLILFPGFIYVAMVLARFNKYILLGIYIFMAIIALVAQMLFVQGYFVS